MPKLDIKKLKPKGISLKGLKFKKKPSKKVILLSTLFIVILAFIIIKIIIPKPAPEVKHTVLSKGKIVNSINVLLRVKLDYQWYNNVSCREYYVYKHYYGK